ICGANYTIKRKKNIIKWQCRTFDKKGKKHCASKAIRDDILRETTKKVLNIKEFDEGIFNLKIEYILVSDGNILKYMFKDGSIKEITWKNPSRKDSWTSEMCNLARERSMKQNGK
ncbi:MAG: recombinase zinc beta ribbon domain-containing protein, partial [Firmicutes bacterium]|nr:recombinase zinc beta ribbon domain-containing protein [Bacillota bacterium]